MPKAVTNRQAGGITREGLLSSPWPGFTVPRYTQVPDEVFDVLMPILTEAEFKCLCYICRRTFGFRKEADAISLNQMSEGIRTRDGRVIDRGTGLGKTSVKKALAFLIKAGVVQAQKRISEERGFETNVYSLHLLSATPTKTDSPNDPSSSHEGGHNVSPPRPHSALGVGQNVSYPRTDLDLGVGQNMSTQEREVNTVNNNTLPSVVVNYSNKGKSALRESLTDLGLSKSMAGRLISQYGVEAVTRIVEYALYRLSRGWHPRDSLPGWLVSAITQGWEIPSWFRTAAELNEEKELRTRSQQQRLERLEEERRQEEARMMKERARVLRSVGVSKGTDLLWTKVNRSLQERGLWRPALTTAVFGSVSEDRAVVLCGYAFSLDMVKESADAIKSALAALTGRVVEVEVKLEQKLFLAKE